MGKSRSETGGTNGVANRAQDWSESMFRFQSERHLFLITAHMLVEHCEWVISLRYVDAALFDEILPP
jgi:hypothetical protein